VSAAPTIAAQPKGPRRSRLGTTSKVVIGTTATLILGMTGIIFLSLAFAFPVVVPLIQDGKLGVPADQIILAKEFAGFWWAFAAAGTATLAASVLVAVKLQQHIDPADAE
jgi:hypothetical protein